MSTRASAFVAALAATLLFCLNSPTFAQDDPIRAGQNGTGPGHHITLLFDPFPDPNQDPANGHWVLGNSDNGLPLIADPSAPPMEKWFMTPTGTGGQPLPLQPGWFAPVWENFLVWPGDPATGTPRSPAITDWHEHIHTPGWIWRVPPVGSTNTSLITRDGEPWPWDFIPSPDGTQNPAWLWVEFPPIEPGHVLDIHKELVWVGTPGNDIWGDTPDENMVMVWEYPTIPEPSTLALALLSLGLLGFKRR